MFSSLAVISTLATAVWAQSSGSATATANPLIPTANVATDCKNFLTSLNTNSALLSSTQALVGASSAYGPGESSSSVSSTQLSSSMSEICDSSTALDESTTRSLLSSFYSACTNELTGSNPNADVVRIYDVLYTLIPMRNAVCSKDDSGKWCVTEIQSSSSSSSASASVALSNNAADNSLEELQSNLYITASSGSLSKRADAIYPNTTTYAQNNLPFLCISGAKSYADLCTTCTRNVFTAYINWESATPYALGLSNSPLLNGQNDLYNAIKSTCGPSFLSGAVQAAGSLSDGSSNNGSFKTFRFDMVAVLLGVASMAVFAFL